MTVGTATPRVDYVENGVTTFHPVPFQFFDPDELVVTRIDAPDVEGGPISDANEHVLVLGADYTVAGGAGDVGSITKSTGGIAGATLKIQRYTHRSQLAHYEPGDDFPAAVHEEALDRLEMQIQELEERTLTAEDVRDLIGKTLVAGPGIQIVVNDALNTITISTLDAANFPDCLMLSGDQQAWEGVGDPTGAGGLSEEDVEDIVASLIQAGAGISVVYDDAGNIVTITNTAPGGAEGGALTTEDVQDIVAAFIHAGTGVTVTYDDTGNILTIDAAGGGGAGLTVADSTLAGAIGHYKLSDGFMFQWGVTSIPANSSPKIFYEEAFASFGVPSGSGGHNGTANPNNIRIVSSALDGFTVCNNDPAPANFYWNAMGK
jgi:hypothetical protein